MFLFWLPASCVLLSASFGRGFLLTIFDSELGFLEFSETGPLRRFRFSRDLLTALDAHPSLIAQTLNADGTPKRPMNAFMIFARRRRPQVSAQNQMMRTGEISKILSREWGGMALVSCLCVFFGVL